MSFIHLHNHSQYSFGTGSMPISAMVERAVELGMSAMAITDTDGLFGAYEFFTQCRAAGIRPVLGLQVRVAGIPGGGHAATALILLAENNSGWHNLVELSSYACREGLPGEPVPLEFLAVRTTGLICLSGGSEGTVSQCLCQGNYSAAKRAARALQALFDTDCFFLELQHHGLTEELEATPALLRLSSELGIPLVATNHCEYPAAEDADVHRILRGIISGEGSVGDEISAQWFIKSASEMASLFSGIPGALQNSVRIADRCEVTLKRNKRLPETKLPDGVRSADAHLAELCRTGLESRLEAVTDEYRKQLDAELSVIREQGHADYFLTVHDYVRKAHELGYLTWDRGSASGCMVNFALGITGCDPLAFGLSFERFLNPARRWYGPDIDLDISNDGRDRMMQYLADAYGSKHVARIGSLYRFSLEQAGRRVAEHLKLPSREADRLLYMLLADLQEDDAKEDDLLFFAAAQALTGIPSHPGVHPCGIAVDADPIAASLPFCGHDDGELPILQADTRWTEDAGMTKFDLITSTTLTLFRETCQQIKDSIDRDFDLRKIPLDDARTFQTLRDGCTAGVFQFSAEKTRERLKEVAPETIEHLAALLAICRPGPIFQYDDYVSCRHGRREVRRIHPIFDAIVDDTYGFIVFQEQIQEIGRRVGGLDPSSADLLRRALGKSRDIESHREAFIEGASARDISPEDATAIFDAMSDVCRYTFNKAHAISYARFAYTAAYLKCHYPVEFAAAHINTHAPKSRLYAEVIADAQTHGASVISADINAAQWQSWAVDGSLQLGLNTVRHLSPETAAAIIKERETAGPFPDMVSLCRRLGPAVIDRHALLALIADGALDSLPGCPAQKFAVVDETIAAVRTDDVPAALQSERLAVASFDLVRELITINRWQIRDVSFDVYCPKTYSHHLRFTVWLPPDTVIFDMDTTDLIDRSRSFVGQLQSEKKDDYVIGLNSRIDQYDDRHLLMLDLDSIDDAALARLADIGGYLLKSGVGYHFIGRELLPTQEKWLARLDELQRIPEFKGHLDDTHIAMSRKRGYSTLRLIESPAKPVRPVMIKVL